MWKRNFCFSYRIRGEESTVTKRYRVTVKTLRYISALPHNAICCGEKLLLLEVIALGMEAVITIHSNRSGNSKPLSLLKVFALTARQK